MADSIFLEKIFFLEKKSKNISRIGWFGVYKMFNPLICAFFGFTWNNNCLYDSAKTICLGKIWLYAKMPLPNQIAWFFKFEYLKKFLKYVVFFLHLIRYSWKLLFDHAIIFGCGQTSLGLSKVFWNNKVLISSDIVGSFYWLFACS